MKSAHLALSLLLLIAVIWAVWHLWHSCLEIFSFR